MGGYGIGSLLPIFLDIILNNLTPLVIITYHLNVEKTKKNSEKKTKGELTILGERFIFGSPSRTSGDMVWGIFLITVGSLLLLNFLDILPWIFWESVINFWPVLVVLFGVTIVVGNSPIARIFVLLLTLSIFAFVIMFGLKQSNLPVSRTFPEEINYLIESWEDIKQ